MKDTGYKARSIHSNSKQGPILGAMGTITKEVGSKILHKEKGNQWQMGNIMKDSFLKD